MVEQKNILNIKLNSTQNFREFNEIWKVAKTNINLSWIIPSKEEFNKIQFKWTRTEQKWTRTITELS